MSFSFRAMSTGNIKRMANAARRFPLLKRINSGRVSFVVIVPSKSKTTIVLFSISF